MLIWLGIGALAAYLAYRASQRLIEDAIRATRIFLADVVIDHILPALTEAAEAVVVALVLIPLFFVSHIETAVGVFSGSEPIMQASALAAVYSDEPRILEGNNAPLLPAPPLGVEPETDEQAYALNAWLNAWREYIQNNSSVVVRRFEQTTNPLRYHAYVRTFIKQNGIAFGSDEMYKVLADAIVERIAIGYGVSAAKIELTEPPEIKEYEAMVLFASTPDGLLYLTRPNFSFNERHKLFVEGALIDTEFLDGLAYGIYSLEGLTSLKTPEQIQQDELERIYRALFNAAPPHGFAGGFLTERLAWLRGNPSDENNRELAMLTDPSFVVPINVLLELLSEGNPVFEANAYIRSLNFDVKAAETIAELEQTFVLTELFYAVAAEIAVLEELIGVTQPTITIPDVIVGGTVIPGAVTANPEYTALTERLAEITNALEFTGVAEFFNEPYRFMPLDTELTKLLQFQRGESERARGVFAALNALNINFADLGLNVQSYAAIVMGAEFTVEIRHLLGLASPELYERRFNEIFGIVRAAMLQFEEEGNAVAANGIVEHIEALGLDRETFLDGGGVIFDRFREHITALWGEISSESFMVLAEIHGILNSWGIDKDNFIDVLFGEDAPRLLEPEMLEFTRHLAEQSAFFLLWHSMFAGALSETNVFTATFAQSISAMLANEDFMAMALAEQEAAELGEESEFEDVHASVITMKFFYDAQPLWRDFIQNNVDIIADPSRPVNDRNRYTPRALAALSGVRVAGLERFTEVPGMLLNVDHIAGTDEMYARLSNAILSGRLEVRNLSLFAMTRNYGTAGPAVRLEPEITATVGLPEYFITHPTVNFIFWGITLTSLVLVVGFAIYEVSRSMGDLQLKKPVNKVLSLTGKSVLTMLLVPLLFVVSLYLMSAVTSAATAAIHGANEPPSLAGAIFYTAVVPETVTVAGDRAVIERFYVDGEGFIREIERNRRLPPVVRAEREARYEVLRDAYLFGARSGFGDFTEAFNNIRRDFDVFSLVFPGNWFMVVLVAWFMCICMIFVMVVFIRRVFDLILLYIISPLFASTIPLDDGRMFGQWRERFIAAIISGGGSILMFAVFIMVLPLIWQPELRLAADSFGNFAMKSLITMGAVFVCYKSNTMITAIVNPEAAAEERGTFGFVAGAAMGGAMMVKEIGQTAIEAASGTDTQMVSDALGKFGGKGESGNKNPDTNLQKDEGAVDKSDA